MNEIENLIQVVEENEFFTTIRNLHTDQKPLLMKDLQFPTPTERDWITVPKPDTVIGYGELNARWECGFVPIESDRTADALPPTSTTPKADIEMVGYAWYTTDGTPVIYNWTFNGRGRDCAGIDFGNQTICGWTVDELIQISKDYHEAIWKKGISLLPIRGND